MSASMKHGALVTDIENAWIKVDDTRPEVRETYKGQDRIHFVWTPEEFTSSVGANWSDVAVLGRSEPFKIYENTGSREIPVEFIFFAQGGFTKSGVAQAIEHEVLSQVRFLESLAYPIELPNGQVAEPAACFLKLGGFIYSRVIMSGPANVTYGGPWEPEEMLPYQAQVSCTFAEVNRIPKSAKKVLGKPPELGDGVTRTTQRLLPRGEG